MSISVSLQGFDVLEQALAQLSNAAAKGVLQRAGKAALEPVAEEARKNARRNWRTGQLHNAIEITTKQANEVGRAAYAATMRSGGSRAQAVDAMRTARRTSGRANVEIYLGVTDKAPHAHLIEFGTVHHRPFPFMRPAWDTHKADVLVDLKTAIADEIAKTVLRSQRRAANAAARAARTAAVPAPAPIIVSAIP